VLSEAAAKQESIEIVADDPTGTLDERAEVVLAVTPDPHESATARALFFASHAVRVALLTPAGRELVIYDLSSQPIAAVDLPASELLDVVCRGVPDTPRR
jgi:ABC-type lipoprotein export system ATPase subunit